MAPPRRRIRLLIADDERLFREGLALLLATESRFQVVGHPADGIEAIDLCRRLNPDLLLLDPAMPRLAGLQALEKIAAESPQMRTIVVTGAITRDAVVAVLHRGAHGIVLKDLEPQLLFKSIHAVMRGQYWIGRDVRTRRRTPEESPGPAHPRASIQAHAP